MEARANDQADPSAPSNELSVADPRSTALARSGQPTPAPPPSAAAEFSGVMAAGVLHGLAASIGLGDLMTSHGCVQFVGDLQTESGGSSDPLVAVLTQQIGIAQAATGLLVAKAAGASNAADAVAYSTAATRLLGELRRCISTAAELRSGGPHAPVVNQIVGQQNVAAGPQQVSFSPPGKKGRRKPN